MRNQSALDRRRLTKMVLKLLDLWGLASAEKAAVLGFAPSNLGALARLQSGAPMNGRRQLDRAVHLLRIHESLRMLFPQNRDLAYRWMTTKNRAFGGKSPIRAVVETRGQALLEIRAYLAEHTGVSLPLGFDPQFQRAKRAYQQAGLDAVARGEKSQEDLFFIPPAVARAAKILVDPGVEGD